MLENLIIEQGQYEMALNYIQKDQLTYPLECKKVVDKINELASDIIPDYIGFSNYLLEIFKDIKDIPSFDSLLDNGQYTQIGFSALLYILNNFIKMFYEVKNGLIDFSNDVSPKNYKIFKIYYKFFENHERMIITSLELYKTGFYKEMPTDFRKMTPIQTKNLLYSAFKEKNKEMALKAWGRIDGLDEGEYEYFEAIIHYMDSDYEQSLLILDKIRPEHIDYFNAMSLKLKIYAYLGKINEFNKLSKIIIKTINRNMIKEFLQILFVNLDLYELSNNYRIYFEKAERIIKATNNENDKLFLTF